MLQKNYMIKIKELLVNQNLYFFQVYEEKYLGNCTLSASDVSEQTSIYSIFFLKELLSNRQIFLVFYEMCKDLLFSFFYLRLLLLEKTHEHGEIKYAFSLRLFCKISFQKSVFFQKLCEASTC
jgi:hypothetical protein